VPFSVAGKATTVVQYQANGIYSNSVTLPVVATKPAIFTLNQSGTGAAAALDAASFKAITSANPVARGGIALVYMTGAGQTTPAGVDGQISTAAPPPQVNGVTATIGGVNAPVLYTGGAVGLVHGGIQLNIQIPSTVPPGDQLLIVNVGSQSSQTGVTIAVR